VRAQRSVSLSSIETEQCREQEQEKEEEKEAEQQVELERFSMLNYARDGEEPTRWCFARLKDSTMLFKSKAMYAMKNFALHGRPSLPFPEPLAMTRNYHNAEWVGDRRIKNCVMVAEWVPSVAILGGGPGNGQPPTAPPAKRSVRQQSRREQGGMSAQSLSTLRSTLALFDVGGHGAFAKAELQAVLHASGDEGADAADVLAEEGGATALSTEQISSLLISGRHRRSQPGRRFLLVSLAEAETLRFILHQRQGQALVEGADVALALRCLPAGDVVFDQSTNMPSAPSPYPAAVARACFRFFDGKLSRETKTLTCLPQVVQSSTRSASAAQVTCTSLQATLSSCWCALGLSPARPLCALLHGACVRENHTLLFRSAPFQRPRPHAASSFPR
jgi:hypothetical protein